MTFPTNVNDFLMFQTFKRIFVLEKNTFCHFIIKQFIDGIKVLWRQ